MLLFLLLLLDAAVAFEDNESSAPFDGVQSVSGMSTETFTEHSVEGSKTNSEEPYFGSNFGHSTKNTVNSMEFESVTSTEMVTDRSVVGFSSNSDELHLGPHFSSSTDNSVNGADSDSEMSTEMFTERSAGGSDYNSTESNISTTELEPGMIKGMPKELGVQGFSVKSDKEHPEPYFDNSTESNVTAQLGSTATLSCRVRNLKGYSVAWIRPEEHAVLAIDRHVISRDSRITSYHLENSDDWNLKIQPTTQKDAGLYMCQVNTTPMISFSIVLNIVVPKATIKEGSNLYIKAGGTILVTCIINGGTTPLNDVAWFQGDKSMDHYSYTEEGYSPEEGYYYASGLKIFRAQSIHSGNYSCKPNNSEPASISVHVFNGWKPNTMTVKPVTMKPVTMKPVTMEPVTMEPVTMEPVTMKPVTMKLETMEPVTIHHGQKPSTAFRFMPLPLLLLLLSILWIFQSTGHQLFQPFGSPQQCARR